MVKLNIAIFIGIFIIAGISLFQIQSKEIDNNDTKTVISQEGSINESFEKLKDELALVREANENLEQENIKLKSNNQELKGITTELQETKVKLEESNKTLNTEIETLKERSPRSRFGRRNNDNASPYTIGENEGRENNWRRNNPERVQQMRDWTGLRIITNLPSLTAEQKAFHQTLREELKEFRIQMIREEDQISREEAWRLQSEKMEAYKTQIFSSLTTEQTAELNTMIDTELEQFRLDRQERQNRE